MKQVLPLLLITLSFINTCFSQSYNLSLNKDLDIYPEIARNISHAAGSQIYNKSSVALSNITFTWYISSDNILSSDDWVLDSRIEFTNGGKLNASSSAYVGTSILKVPSSVALGCEYYIIMKAQLQSGMNDVDLSDNISMSKVCIVSATADLKATSVILDRKAFIYGINSDKVTFETRIDNQGSLTINQAFNNRLLIGTSPKYDENTIDTINFSFPSLLYYYNKFNNFSVDISDYNPGRYYIHLIADCDSLIGESIESNNVLTTFFEILEPTEGETILMDSAETNYIATCDATITDDGGTTGNYSPNVTRNLYLYPADPSKKIRVELKELEIDKSDRASISYMTAFGSSTYTLPDPVTSNDYYVSGNVNGEMLIYFKSDATVENKGFVYQVSCAPANDFIVYDLKTQKEVYAFPIETINLSFVIKNTGSSGIASLKYQIGISSNENLTDTLALSELKTISNSIYLNGKTTISESLPLYSITNRDNHFVFVKVIGEETKTTIKPITLEPIVVAENDTVLFKNNDTLYYSSCNMKIYDDGGPNGNYADNFSGRILLFPDDTSKFINLKITYDVYPLITSPVYNQEDYLQIFNPNTESVVQNLQSSYETNFKYYARTLPGGAVLLNFKSTESHNKTGFEIQVGCGYKGTDFKYVSLNVKEDTATIGYQKKINYTTTIINNGTTNNAAIAYRHVLSSSKSISDVIKTDLLNAIDYTLNRTIDISSITKEGWYYVLGEIDYDHKIAERDESNNFAIDSFYVHAIGSNEIRLPTEGSDTVKVCGVVLYGAAGKTMGSAVDYNNPKNLVIYPESPDQTLTLTVEILSGTYVYLLIYDRDSITINSIKTLRPETAVLPYIYTAKNPGSPLELEVIGGSLSSYDYTLNARIDCDPILNSGHQFENSLLISPNLVNDYFTVNSKNISSVLVYTVEGQLIKSWTAATNYYPVEELKNGLYIILINTSKGSHTERIVVQK